MLDIEQAGTAIYIEQESYDNTKSPPVLGDPATGPTITLYDPFGTVKVSEHSMTKLTTDARRPNGVFFYVYQSSANDPAGVWKVQYRATAADSGISISRPTPAFQLVS
jgi:hypothetical protein